MMQILKAWVPKKLMARAFVVLVIPVLLIQIISLYVFYDRHLSYVMRQSAADIAGSIAMINEAAGDKKKAENFIKLQRYFAMNATMTDAPWIADKPSNDTWLNDVMREQLSPFIPKDQFHIVFHEDDVDVFIKKPVGTLKVTFIKKRLYSRTIPLFIMWTLGATLLMVSVAFLFTRKQVRIIEDLSRAADHLGRGYDVNDVKPAGAFEIRHLAASFNLMQHRLKKLFHQRKEMLSGIAHDLQKPIARLRAILESQPLQDSFRQSYQDLSAMERMVTGYLTFAKEDRPEVLALVRIGDVLYKAQQACVMPEVIQMQGNLDATFMTMPDKLTHCFFHVIDNGCRFARSLVEITVHHDRCMLYVTIDDDGNGVPEHLYDDLFKPFFKIPIHGSDEHEGVGLGLAIAQDVVTQLGGTIGLSVSPLGGLRASIVLPVVL